MKKIFALIIISILCSVAFAQDNKESFGLLLDNSGSLRTQLVFEKNLAKEIVKRIIQRGNISVLHFATNEEKTKAAISLGSDFSVDEKSHISVVDNLATVPGQTALIDAIYFVSEKINSQQIGIKDKNLRKILIIITDGEDRSSRMKPKELAKYLKDAEINVYAIGLVEQLSEERGFTAESPKRKAKAFLKSITQDIGGRVVFPAEKDSVLEIVNLLLETNIVKPKQ